MDYEWARGKLVAYVSLVDDYWRAQEMREEEAADAVLTLIKQAAPLTHAILERLPGVDPGKRLGEMDYWLQRDRTLEGLGVLDLLGAVEQLGPAGPSLNAGSLHPWVWQAAQTFWDSKHFAQAVEQAWKSINAHLQQKTQRLDVSDDALVNETMSLSAPAGGKTKLRARGDQSSPSWTSKQRGMHALAQACAAGIRNVLAHEALELPSQTALEYLATMSVLARWIDDATTETGAESVPGRPGSGS
ncbi:TIGR02391 family protein [Micromonospora sp. NPDC051006]|uniref:TIGR02391 family protein n=1 Tax=Micromonospora sp. NPDC051006 TaxID=3364283 RepID=UPI003790DEE1